MKAPFRYYGGKGQLLKKIAGLVPKGGMPYVEPYCGAATLFFHREPAPVEVLNDLAGDVVNVFRVLQDRETFEELRHRLTWTPYARAEFVRALEILKSDNHDPVDRAWAFMVAMNQGFGGKEQMSSGNWGRVFVSSRGMAENCSKWLMRLSLFDSWHDRLMRVQIDNRDALEVIRYWDNTEAVFYLDPPYVLSTRKDARGYKHELSDDHHRKLVETILDCKGSVVLSGYNNPIYKPLEDAGWQRVDIKTVCYAAGRVRGSGLQGDGAAKAKVQRVESVWINPKAQNVFDLIRNKQDSTGLEEEEQEWDDNVSHILPIF